MTTNRTSLRPRTAALLIGGDIILTDELGPLVLRYDPAYAIDRDGRDYAIVWDMEGRGYAIRASMTVTTIV